VEPGAATKDTHFAITTGPSRTVGGRSIVGIVIAILDPLEDVAVHLIETPRVRLEGVDRECPALRVAEAVVVCLAGGDRGAPPEGRGRPSTRDLFALGFAQQPVGLAGLARQPGHVGLRVVPAYTSYRPSVATPA